MDFAEVRTTDVATALVIVVGPIVLFSMSSVCIRTSGSSAVTWPINVWRKPLDGSMIYVLYRQCVLLAANCV